MLQIDNNIKIEKNNFELKKESLNKAEKILESIYLDIDCDNIKNKLKKIIVDVNAVNSDITTIENNYIKLLMSKNNLLTGIEEGF